MKKILAFLLAALMLSAMFAVPASAADNVNYQTDFDFIQTAPKVDGVVNAGEYGDVLPHTTFSQNRGQFVYTKGHTKYTNWDFDFYAAWDANALYLAWVVDSDIHGPVPKKQLGDSGEVIGDDYANNMEDTLQKMWMYSCVQLVITPGNPTQKDYQNPANWLEVGFCEMDDGTTGRAVWGVPNGKSIDDVSLNDWSAAVKRDKAAKTTTYEVAIPWDISGVAVSGTNAQFGLAYAVATQEQYNLKTPAMIEWQDVILTGSSLKNANKCAVVTLKGGNVVQKPHQKVDGTRPADVASKTCLTVSKVNGKIVGGDTALITDIKGNLGLADDGTGYNLLWTYNMLLKPTGNAGEYELVDAQLPTGAVPEFAVPVEDGMIIVGVHSDGVAGSDSSNNRTIAESITIGSILKAWEITLTGDKPDTKYTNSCLYVTKEVVSVDPSADILEKATVDLKVEKDGDIGLFEATDADKVLSAADLANAYILVFDAEGKMINVGEKPTGDVTIPKGGSAVTFFYDEDSEPIKSTLALKYLYDGAIEAFVTDEVADNGLRTIDAEKNCPYTITYDVVDGVADFFISKTAFHIPDVSVPDVSVDDTSKDDSSAAASSDASGADDEGGSNLGLIIGIIAGVLVLAGAGVAVFFILKKKKAA